MDYKDAIEDKLEDLISYGYCKLPSVKSLINQSSVFENCKNEMGPKTYFENSKSHLNFLKLMGLYDHLPAVLHKIAKSEFNYSGPLTNSYNIARLVRPGDQSEGYRGHFDAHLFTLVIPINIPGKNLIKDHGQLNFFPNLRKHPRNELENIVTKIHYKRFSNKAGFLKLSHKHEHHIEDFLDYSPLLFVGTTTLHGNAPVDKSACEPRLSFLSHYFDPTKYGVSALLRKLRRR